MDADLLDILNDCTIALSKANTLLSRDDLTPEIRAEALAGVDKIGKTLETITYLQKARINQ